MNIIITIVMMTIRLHLTVMWNHIDDDAVMMTMPSSYVRHHHHDDVPQ
jgi:hypothetical protein